MQSYGAEGYGRMSLLGFLTHYIIRLYEIQPADDLRATAYCDNSSLRTAEEECHTRDVDSSSWYLKLDRDIIVSLSEAWEMLPFKLVSLHVRSPQDDKRDYANLARPEQLNDIADHRAKTALNDLRVAGQRT
jgi:transcriptional antiterminator Rof (Rho-off)